MKRAALSRLSTVFTCRNMCVKYLLSIPSVSICLLGIQGEGVFTVSFFPY